VIPEHEETLDDGQGTVLHLIGMKDVELPSTRRIRMSIYGRWQEGTNFCFVTILKLEEHCPSSDCDCTTTLLMHMGDLKALHEELTTFFAMVPNLTDKESVH
jgi:hypothetical protein